MNRRTWRLASTAHAFLMGHAVVSRTVTKLSLCKGLEFSYNFTLLLHCTILCSLFCLNNFCFALLMFRFKYVNNNAEEHQLSSFPFFCIYISRKRFVNSFHPPERSPMMTADRRADRTGRVGDEKLRLVSYVRFEIDRPRRILFRRRRRLQRRLL